MHHAETSRGASEPVSILYERLISAIGPSDCGIVILVVALRFRTLRTLRSRGIPVSGPVVKHVVRDTGLDKFWVEFVAHDGTQVTVHACSCRDATTPGRSTRLPEATLCRPRTSTVRPRYRGSHLIDADRDLRRFGSGID